MPRRLSLDVGVSSSESGSHSSPEHLDLLDPLGVVELGHDLGRGPRRSRRSTSGCSASSASDSRTRCPCCAAHTGATSGSSTTSAETNGRWSPMARGLADERDHLERRLEVGGADVLAAGGDDQLLLAVDDAEVAVVVDLADVAGVQPAVGVEGLGGLLGIVEVALEHVAAPADDLAVVGELHLAPGDGRADRAGLDLVRRPRSSGPAFSRHAVDLRQRHADGAEPAEQVGGDRGGAGDGELAAASSPRSSRTAGTPPRRGTPRWRSSSSVAVPQSMRLDDGAGGLDGLVELLLLLRVGGERGLTPA